VNCKIIGDTDFIFGGATAVFENCEIVSTPKGGYVTAASTDSRKLRISVLKLQIDKRCSQKFNISWKTLASQCICSLQNMLFGSAYKGVRLDRMSGNLPENARFFEYKNTGPGAVVNSSRRQLSDAEAANLLRKTY